MKATAPNGKPIIGTLERLTARAEIIEDSFKMKNGELLFEYQGSTEIFWDSQETVNHGSGWVYLDEDGNEWNEDQLTLAEATV